MEAKPMDHFHTPTMLLVWPDDTHEVPHYVATPLWNCRPDPLYWLANFAEACILRDDDGNVLAGNPPDHVRVFVPQDAPGSHAAVRLSGYLDDMRRREVERLEALAAVEAQVPAPAA
jgi:hypothetical protein